MPGLARASPNFSNHIRCQVLNLGRVAEFERKSWMPAFAGMTGEAGWVIGSVNKIIPTTP
jgi:hypothetical protein